MLMPERLESYLDNNHIAYSLILHVPTHSAQVAASFMHFPGKEVAKAVALCAGEKVLLAILPASYHINFEKLSTIVGDRVQLLEQEKCNEAFPDCETGAIPPFGELYGVPVFLDEALAEDEKIVLGAGTLSESIRMGSADFVRLAKPKICSFAEKAWSACSLPEALAQGSAEMNSEEALISVWRQALVDNRVEKIKLNGRLFPVRRTPKKASSSS